MTREPCTKLPAEMKAVLDDLRAAIRPINPAVRTEKITGAPAGIGLHELGPDGTILIDWRAVETAANGPADRMSAPVAKVMLAIRDSKWKSMSH